MTSHLSYSIPDKQRKKRILRIPESHSLYVCPQSCARRQAIRALRNGEANRMSVLQLAQEDLVSGDYEGQVGDAVEQLLAAFEQPPRVIQVLVNCVDDFVGTDGETLVEGLRERFPDVRFSLSHINPIAVDVSADFAGKMHAGLYGLLEQPTCRDAGVSVFGSFEPLPAQTELHAALAAAGAGPVRHIASCQTFAEYQQLAAGAVALSVARGGSRTAQEVAKRFDMRFVSWLPTYGIAEVDRRYRELACALEAAAVRDDVCGAFGCATSVVKGNGLESACDKANATSQSELAGAGDEGLRGDVGRYWNAMRPVLAPARERAEAAAARALAAVGMAPVVVGSDASFAPFDIARELLDYGFNVRRVYGLHLKGADTQAEARLRKAYPQVEIVREESVEAVRQGGAGSAFALGIGLDARFLAGAPRVVDIYHDEGYFGYQGIERLMNEIVVAMDAQEEERSLRPGDK